MTEPSSAKPSPGVQTHERMDAGLSGEPVDLAEGRARLVLETVESMRADARGLVHGGFVFSLADHAAMLAINHPNVVLGSSAVRFLRPVQVGDRLLAEAEIDRRDGKKIIVRVVVGRMAGEAGAGAPEIGEPVLEGEFICFTPPRHVLDR